MARRQELINLAVDVSATGQSAALDLSENDNVCWVAELATLTGGTSPDVTFSWDHSPNNSNWYTIASEAALTAAGVKSRTTAENLFRFVRISWVTTGSPTGATANLFMSGS
jgi:hypothetical protein